MKRDGHSKPLPTPVPAVVAQEVDGGVEFGEGAFQAAEAGLTVGALDRRGAGFQIVARNLFKKVDHLI